MDTLPVAGQVRVGRLIGKNKPQMTDYKNIVVMLKSSSKWWPLSPYYLQNEDAYIMENLWQFSKIYSKVPKSTQRWSRWDATVTWDWPAEEHIDSNGNILPAYWKWREAGFKNPLPVRYPVGYNYKHTVKYSLSSKK